MSRLANVFESVAWYVFRRGTGKAVLGAELGPLFTVSEPVSCSTDGALLGGSLGALRVIGGGLFLPPPAPAVGACLMATGSGSEGGGAIGSATASCRALKLRFLRRGVDMVGMKWKVGVVVFSQLRI